MITDGSVIRSISTRPPARRASHDMWSMPAPPLQFPRSSRYQNHSSLSPVVAGRAYPPHASALQPTRAARDAAHPATCFAAPGTASAFVAHVAPCVLSDELRQHCLLNCGTMAIDDRLRPAERIHQLRRHDDVPESAGREQHLTERSAIDHAIARIQPCSEATVAYWRSDIRCRNRLPESSCAEFPAQRKAPIAGLGSSQHPFDTGAKA